MTRSSSPTQVVLATVGVALALLLAALDQTIVGVAMPRIVAQLHGLSYYAWVTTAYLITSTALVPVAGKLGDMFGRKPFLLVGMIGFIAASALCGISQNMVELVLFRGLQGAFGGVLFASTFAVLADVFPPAQRARMSGLFGAVFGLSSVVGPTLGGFLTDGPGWRWVFYVNVPLGVAAALLVATQLPYVRSSARLRDIDWLGTGLLFAGLTPLLIALSMTRDHAWLSTQVMGLLTLAAVALVAFYLIERRVEHPVVPFQLFKLNVFAVPAVISFFSGIGDRGPDPAHSNWSRVQSPRGHPRHHHHRRWSRCDVPAHPGRDPGGFAAPAHRGGHEPAHLLEKPRRDARNRHPRFDPDQPAAGAVQPAWSRRLAP